MPICSACAREFPDGSRFCTECGRKLGDSAGRPSSSAAPSPAAERRHVTAIFCDLVESTRLSAIADPEDWREAMAAYRGAATAAIERFGGQVTQFQGDAVVAYMGFPRAHEEDASRAVHAGLAILDALEDVNGRVSRLGIPELRVRIGIHAGQGVVERVGFETAVVGVTTHIAARIQSLAVPGTIVVTENVRLLTSGEFVTQELGTFSLKGIERPPRLHTVLASSGVRSRLKGVERLTPFVGRERELATLSEAWTAVKEGAGRAVLLTGEAGIGKSRLILTLQETLAADVHTWLECGATPYTTHAAFAPIVEMILRGLHLAEGDQPDDKLARLRRRAHTDGLGVEEIVDTIAPLLGLEHEPASPPGADPEARSRTIEMLAGWAITLGQRQPLVLLIEDLHWCDPSTMEVLRRIVERLPDTRMLLVMTSRPEGDLAWASQPPVESMPLGRLPKAAARQMLRLAYDAHALPPLAAERIVERAEGIPLYVEELARMVVEQHGGDAAAAHALEVPETLHDLLAARLDGLGEAKEVAQLAGVIGREVPLRLLERLSGLSPEALSASLDQLVDAGILLPRGVEGRAIYMFKHALIQDAAYQSLLKSARKQHHGRVADELVASFPEVVATQPEVVARHYTEARRASEAVSMWINAARHALECSAHLEAIAYAESGLSLLGQIPDNEERLRAELGLQLVLGPSLMSSRGYADPSMERAYTRAHQICHQLGDAPELFPVMFGLWTFHCVRARHGEAAAIAFDMTALARKERSDALLLEADVCAGITAFYTGDFATACNRLQRVLQLYDETRDADHPMIYGQDPRAAAYAHLMLSLWTLGDVSGALRASHEALLLARSLSHPFSAGYILSFAAWLHRLRGDASACLALAEESIEVCGKRELAVFLAIAEILRGSALASLGQHADGLHQLDAGIAHFRATASTLITPFWAALRAQVLADLGRCEEGLADIDEALSGIAQSGERQGEAELQRMRGVLRHACGGPPTEVEHDLRRALDVAESQQAASWRLRAAIALGRHLLRTERAREAQTLLAQARAPFAAASTEPDVVAADALLGLLQA